MVPESRDPHVSPLGAQFELRSGSHRAVIAEIGATLRAYSVGEVDVIDGFSPDEASPAGRGQVLAPWPNRLDGGTYEFGGRKGRAPIDEPEHGNAIHGLVRWHPWDVVATSADSVTLSHVLHQPDAYPWEVELAITYVLGADGLTVTTTATNRSEADAPFGLGSHPYVTVGTALVDEASLEIPARRRLVADARGLPTGDEPVAGTEFDFATPRPIGATQLDTCYTDLERASDGRAVVRLFSPAGDRSVVVWVDGRFPYLMIYTGDTLEPTSRRRRGIAVEPMTCPPNAFRSGIDLIRLEPETPWRGRWGISPTDGRSSRVRESPE